MITIFSIIFRIIVIGNIIGNTIITIIILLLITLLSHYEYSLYKDIVVAAARSDTAPDSQGRGVELPFMSVRCGSLSIDQIKMQWWNYSKNNLLGGIYNKYGIRHKHIFGISKYFCDEYNFIAQ